MNSKSYPIISIDNLARQLKCDPCRSDALSAAKEFIDNGTGTILFNAFLQCIKEQSTSPEIALIAMMRLLERMTDRNPTVAGYFMAKLYPLADRMGIHEIYHAIELWMHQSTSVDLARTLRQLASESIRPALRIRYLKWGEKIEQGSNSNSR